MNNRLWVLGSLAGCCACRFRTYPGIRITKAGNSGIIYRSEELKDLPHALKGYQADIDGANRYTGQNYEERGRTTDD